MHPESPAEKIPCVGILREAVLWNFLQTADINVSTQQNSWEHAFTWTANNWLIPQKRYFLGAEKTISWSRNFSPSIESKGSLANFILDCRKDIWDCVYKYQSNGKGEVPPVPKHIMKMYWRSGSKTPQTPDLGIRQIWVTFMIQLLTNGKSHSTHWIGEWIVPRASFDMVQERRNVTLSGIKLQCPVLNQSLYRLSYPCS